MSIKLVKLSNPLILCCPLFLLPSIFPSIRVFSNRLTLRIKWPTYWSFIFSISLSNEYSGLGFPLGLIHLICLLSKGSLKSLLQHHSLKTSILRRSAFFVTQLPHLYMTIGKVIALTIWTFVDKGPRSITFQNVMWKESHAWHHAMSSLLGLTAHCRESLVHGWKDHCGQDSTGKMGLAAYASHSLSELFSVVGD